MAEVKLDKPDKPKPPPEGQDAAANWRQPIDTIREDLFNEVIYNLTILMRAEQMRTDASLGHWRGIDHALAFVKAMKDAEA